MIPRVSNQLGSSSICQFFGVAVFWWVLDFFTVIFDIFGDAK
jgi:hypothetical protein